MKKHIQQILKEVNTIILPGLGALTVTSDKTGEIMFMPYLKYDDGKLAAFISENENISIEEAKVLISNDVREIISTLDEGKNYSFNGLGLFSKDSTGEIVFDWGSSVLDQKETIEDTEKSKVPSLEFNPIEEPKVIIDKVIPTEENVKIVEDSFIELKTNEINLDVVLPSDEIDESKELEFDLLKSDFESNDKIELETVIIEPIDEVIIEKKAVSIEVENLKPIETKGLEELPTVSEETDLENEDLQVLEIPKKKRGAKFWLLLILLIMLIGGGTYLGLNFKSFKHLISGNKSDSDAIAEEKIIKKLESDETKPTVEKSTSIEQAEPTPEVIEKDVVSEISEPIAVVEEVIKETPKPKKRIKKKSVAMDSGTSSIGTGNFHIILGTFSEKVNALTFVDKLKSEGKNGATMIERDGKFYVSLNSYATKEEAISNLTSAKVNSKNAWVFQKP
jgi:hypothetical protein